MEKKVQRYKAIATISFVFESDAPFDEASDFAHDKLSEILEDNPQGEDFNSFAVQLTLVKLKDKCKLQRIAEFPIEEVLPYTTKEDIKRTYVVKGKSYDVRMNSERYFVFLQSLYCASCGLEGTRMMLELNPGDGVPHFNLYGEENGRLVLMTKDHILAKSKGGGENLENLKNTCSICNNLKAHYDLSYEEVKKLRKLYNNEMKLSRKELYSLINEIREST